MKRLIALLELFRVGKMVADPLKWKRRQITATMLIPVISAAIDLSRAYGYDVPLNHDQIVTFSTLLLMVVNIVLTVITSAHVGVGTADSEGVDEETAPGGPAKP